MTFKVLAATVALTFAAATTAFAADSTFDRTLTVGSSPNLAVSTGSGYIHLHPGSDSQVHIVAHVHSSHGWMGGGSDADSRIQQIVNNPPIVQNGNDITIGEHHNNDLYRNISIDYDITLPHASAISAVTGSGDIEIQDVGANLKAQSGSGTVRAHGIKGPATLGTGSGDIELEQTGPGDVKAETGSGSIRLQGLSGALKAGTGSGDIEADGQPTADWKLSTGSGSIRLGVGSNARFNLDADTGSGSINVAQPITMQGSLNRHHVTGVVNGGGPTIRANTGSGDIQIK
jgi:Putative adhesin